MLTYFLKAQKKILRGTPLVVYKQTHSVGVTGNPSPTMLSNEEYRRRNDIIKTLNAKFPFRFGDVVIPATDKDKAEYRIRHVCKDWNDYKGSETNEHKVEWPKDDNPMIVYATRLSDNYEIVATTAYFKCLAK